jgi:hypothetical protein
MFGGGGQALSGKVTKNAGFLGLRNAIFHILIQIFKSNCKVISYKIMLLLRGMLELGGGAGGAAAPLAFCYEDKGGRSALFIVLSSLIVYTLEQGTVHMKIYLDLLIILIIN